MATEWLSWWLQWLRPKAKHETSVIVQLPVERVCGSVFSYVERFLSSRNNMSVNSEQDYPKASRKLMHLCQRIVT